jgi:diguanylate cyclase (GGDEF)-like protein
LAHELSGMSIHQECYSVLIAAGPAAQPLWRQSFADPALAGWEPLEADSLERARFVVQHDACDVLLLDASLCENADAEALAWLAGQQDVPVLLLVRPEPEAVTAGLSAGVSQWLPRELALAHPLLLAAGLRQVRRWGELQDRHARTAEALHECRRQVNRLVGLLWESTPMDARTRWFTQRHMLERLQEEIARSARHGTHFSVVLGEFHTTEVRALPVPEEAVLAAWTAEQIRRSKRRCDVVGQYGPHGFMLLLANTSETGAVTLCRRLQASLHQSPASGGLAPIASFGIATCADPAATLQGLLSRAEERLERAKANQGSVVT